MIDEKHSVYNFSLCIWCFSVSLKCFDFSHSRLFDLIPTDNVK